MKSPLFLIFFLTISLFFSCHKLPQAQNVSTTKNPQAELKKESSSEEALLLEKIGHCSTGDDLNNPGNNASNCSKN